MKKALIGLLLIAIISSAVIFLNKDKKPLEETSQQKVEKCFDKDGVFTSFITDIKRVMHNPDSMEIARMEHKRIATGNTNVFINIRAKNQFGELSLSTYEFKITDDCNVYINSVIEDGVKAEFDSGYAIPPTP